METNVIGIKIVRNLIGFTDLFEYNSTPVLNNSIHDIRELLLSVDNLSGNSVAILLTNQKEGSIITLATWLAGIRGDESISAWIYVPNNIKITGEELASIIEATKAELTSTQRNDHKLTELFSRRYDVDPVARPVYVSFGKENAYRYYGHEISLSYILDNLYQPYYKDFKQVFLLDYRANLRVAHGTDLTSKKVYARCILMPPAPVEEYFAYVGNERIVRERYYTEGEVITVSWKRVGFKTIDVKFMAAQRMICPSPDRAEMKMSCTYDSIVVKSESGAPVENYRLAINNIMILPETQAHIHLDHIAKTKIDVKANGYEDYSAEHDLTTGRITVFLKKGVITYRFLFPTKNSHLRTEYKSETVLTKSPFKGYIAVRPLNPNIDNVLKFKAFNTTKKLIISGLFLVVLVLGVAAGWFGANYYNDSIAPLNEIEALSSDNLDATTTPADSLEGQPGDSLNASSVNSPKGNLGERPTEPVQNDTIIK